MVRRYDFIISKIKYKTEKTLYIFLILANCSDPDETPHSSTFHLGFVLFAKVPVEGYLVYKGLTNCLVINTS